MSLAPGEALETVYTVSNYYHLDRTGEVQLDLLRPSVEVQGPEGIERVPIACDSVTLMLAGPGTRARARRRTHQERCQVRGLLDRPRTRAEQSRGRRRLDPTNRPRSHTRAGRDQVAVDSEVLCGLVRHPHPKPGRRRERCPGRHRTRPEQGPQVQVHARRHRLVRGRHSRLHDPVLGRHGPDLPGVLVAAQGRCRTRTGACSCTSSRMCTRKPTTMRMAGRTTSLWRRVHPTRPSKTLTATRPFAEDIYLALAPRHDVNGDGRGDLVTTMGGNAYVYPGMSNAGFSAYAASFNGTLDSALWDDDGHYLVEVADMNRDGYDDLFTCSNDGHRLQLFRLPNRDLHDGSGLERDRSRRCIELDLRRWHRLRAARLGRHRWRPELGPRHSSR